MATHCELSPKFGTGRGGLVFLEAVIGPKVGTSRVCGCVASLVVRVVFGSQKWYWKKVVLLGFAWFCFRRYLRFESQHWYWKKSSNFFSPNISTGRDKNDALQAGRKEVEWNEYNELLYMIYNNQSVGHQGNPARDVPRFDCCEKLSCEYNFNQSVQCRGTHLVRCHHFEHS